MENLARFALAIVFRVATKPFTLADTLSKASEIRSIPTEPSSLAKAFFIDLMVIDIVVMSVLTCLISPFRGVIEAFVPSIPFPNPKADAAAPVNPLFNPPNPLDSDTTWSFSFPPAATALSKASAIFSTPTSPLVAFSACDTPAIRSRNPAAEEAAPLNPIAMPCAAFPSPSIDLSAVPAPWMDMARLANNPLIFSPNTP